MQLCAGLVLNSSSSHDVSHRRALKRRKVNAAPRRGLCHYTKAAAEIRQGVDGHKT